MAYYTAQALGKDLLDRFETLRFERTVPSGSIPHCHCSSLVTKNLFLTPCFRFDCFFINSNSFEALIDLLNFFTDFHHFGFFDPK